MDEPVLSPVALAPVGADTFLGGSRIGIVARIQDHLLHVAEEGFERVVVGTPLGQADPMQLELAHHPAGEAGFARMSTVLIQDHPYLLSGIPTADLAHEASHRRRVFPASEPPAHPAAVELIEAEEVEEAPGLLVARDFQALGRSVAAPPVGLDCDGLLIEEHQHARAGAVAPDRANAGQNRWSLRVITAELALEAAEVDPPFLSRRRRCSRLRL
jgi:hypothetical protein